MSKKSERIGTNYINNVVGAVGNLPKETLCKYFSFSEFDKRASQFSKWYGECYTPEYIEFLRTKKPEDMPRAILVECFDIEQFGHYLLDNKIS